MRRSPYFVYGLLGAFWLGIAAWQVVEHQRFEQRVEQGQLNHAHDIANSLGVVIRSQRRFGTVRRERLVDALEELASSRELLGVAMLNPTGEVVASGGQTIPGDLANLAPGSSTRSSGHLVVAALVELGPERLPPPHGPASDWTPDTARTSTAVLTTPEEFERPKEPPPDEQPMGPPTEEEQRSQRRARWDRIRQNLPYFSTPEKYRELYEKQGLHMMVLMLSDANRQTVVAQDLVMRLVLALVALCAALGLGLAWRSLSRSAGLQVRLARARAMNTYLRELNLAAAGLAHETRNPLNIVRGIAQVVAQDDATPAASRQQLHSALDEVDRITARLNEFIDYSKPREPHLVPTSPVTIARDVARTLETDLEDKQITFTCAETGPDVMADPTMLRQVCFNLLLNATQAVPAGGNIQLSLEADGPNWRLDVADNGPGVAADLREEVFRPYFTLSEQGSGLGLAIVRQIVLAHGWEITCLDNPGGGALFRITGIETSGPA